MADLIEVNIENAIKIVRELFFFIINIFKLLESMHKDYGKRRFKI